MGAVLPLVLDRHSDASLAAQIAAGIRELVAAGALIPDEPVPSTRRLADQLAVSRGTVVAAYDQLISESYLVSRPGGSTRVHPRAGALTRPAFVPAGRRRDEGGHPAADPASLVVDLRPHRRVAPRMDDPAWREAWRRAATEPRQPQRGPDRRDRAGSRAQGLPELRRAIAEHLRLLRSMQVDPDDIVLTAGARDGLTLLLGALPESLAPVAVETPGYPGLRRVLSRLDVPTVETETDTGGVITEHIPPTARSVLVTPNHLFPAATSMPAPRRIDLLRKAAAAGLLVIEDDFDSGYRHVGAPLPTLWDLAPESVLHLGTFTQVLTPDAAVGYVIAPESLVPELTAAREDLGSGASAIAQRAVARFLDSGGLRRSIARRRRDLVRRRERLLTALAGHEVEMVSGAHAVVRLPSAHAARTVAEACLAQGVLVGDLGGYWGTETVKRAPAAHAEPGGTGEDSSTAHGIVLNCADASPNELDEALRIIAETLASPSQTGIAPAGHPTAARPR